MNISNSLQLPIGNSIPKSEVHAKPPKYLNKVNTEETKDLLIEVILKGNPIQNFILKKQQVVIEKVNATNASEKVNATTQQLSQHLIKFIYTSDVWSLNDSPLGEKQPIDDLIEATKKQWDLKRWLTNKQNKPILKHMSLTALASPQCDVEFRTLNKYTGVNTPLIGFFYVHSKALTLIMVECVSGFGRWFPVFHSTNLHTLPPNSFRTDGGSSFTFTGDY